MPVPARSCGFGSPLITVPRRCAGTLGHFNFSPAVYAFKHCKLLSG